MLVRGTAHMEDRGDTSFVPLGIPRLMGMLGKQVEQSLTSGCISHPVLQGCFSVGPRPSFPL